MMLRPAIISDADSIVSLIDTFAEKNLMLPITHDFLFEHISNYQIAEKDGKIIGCVFLRVYNGTLAEVRSLAVDPQYQGQGIGKALVEQLKKVAREIGLKKLFALTVTPLFFKHLGFVETDKESFPEKIWLDCDKCQKRDKCDEIAFVYEIGSS